MIIRTMTGSDFDAAIALYQQLRAQAPLANRAAFETLLLHPGTEIWCVCDGLAAVAMTSLHILPNMTQGGRPYALIENVVTHADFRGQGYGRRVIEAALTAAWDEDCYKVMLFTGQNHDARGFYERLGFRTDEKWGMIQRRAP